MKEEHQPTNLPGPFLIPAAWRGTELFRRDDWLVELQEHDLREIDTAVQGIERTGVPVVKTTAADFPLPRFGQVLATIQDRLETGSGACMIRGLPVEKYSEQQLRQICWGISQHLGTPVSQSASGERIFSVRDEGHQPGEAQTRGPNTKKRLNFHTDRCDVIGFLCLRQAISGGDNQLVSSVTLYNEMRARWPESAQVLMEPFYYQRHNVDTGNQLSYCRQPIFSFFNGHFAASYLRVLIDRAAAMPDIPDMTAAQLEALERLESLAFDPALHVTFRQHPGDMLFLNNWITFHRRDEFEDAPQPELRRHLLRIWLAVPNSRPLDPLFAANFGATSAGAIRGGMRPVGHSS